jgi:hypothetical protein
MFNNVGKVFFGMELILKPRRPACLNIFDMFNFNNASKVFSDKVDIRI